jgi:hypothetical protein
LFRHSRFIRVWGAVLFILYLVYLVAVYSVIG